MMEESDDLLGGEVSLEIERIPVPLIQVIARDHSIIAGTELLSSIGITLEGGTGLIGTKGKEGKDTPTDLEDQTVVTEGE